jgi:hypothetical protein
MAGIFVPHFVKEINEILTLFNLPMFWPVYGSGKTAMQAFLSARYHNRSHKKPEI